MRKCAMCQTHASGMYRGVLFCRTHLRQMLRSHFTPVKISY